MSSPIITSGKGAQQPKVKTQPKKTPRKYTGWWKRAGYFILGAELTLLILPSMVIGSYWFKYRGRIYPQIMVNNINLGGLKPTEAQVILSRQIAAYQKSWPLKLTYENYQWTIPYQPQAIKFQTEQTVQAAYRVGRTGSWGNRLREWWLNLQQSQTIPLNVEIDQRWLTDLSASLSAQINTDSIPPSITILPVGKTQQGSRIVIEPGETGRSFNQEVWQRQLTDRISHLQKADIKGVVTEQTSALSEAQIQATKIRAENLLNKQVSLQTASDSATPAWNLAGEDLIGFMDFSGGYDRQKLSDYLGGVAQTVDSQPQNAKFQFNTEAQKVQEFVPAQNGLTLDIEASVIKLQSAFTTLEQTEMKEPILLVIKETPPEITLAQVNQLGIKELLGKGESTFMHSIPSRVHNVALAASRINGTLVKPGETFSFNQAVGDVSAATGYQQAYIIKEGRTQLGDGGGVCQDSTTTFRAALAAGLPITERHAHAYRVGYYEQNAKVGLDATVYAPSPDLKFLNDTPAYILIQATPDIKNFYLNVSIYGTSDGRKSSITNQTMWDVTPPPPDVYVDDPTIPAGQIKQVDFKAWGAKAKFDYTVTRGDQVLIKKTFTSNYQPWAAVYMRGTGQ